MATKYELKMGSATREAFGKALVELGKKNPNVVALDADLSKSTMTAGFAKEFPERFVECGIAEANMVAIGAGMASAGKIPFAASFSADGGRVGRFAWPPFSPPAGRNARQNHRPPPRCLACRATSVPSSRRSRSSQ